MGTIQSVNAKTEPVAEVISASITGFVGELSSQFTQRKPDFGSYVVCRSEVNNTEIIGVVHNVITGSPDNVHRPTALGLTRDELRTEQPHIFSLLRTEIHAMTIGFKRDGKVFQYLPSQPPDVHDFIYAATRAEIIEITNDFGFLRLLLDVADVPSEELLAALIRQANEARDNSDSNTFLISAGQAISQILRQDYDRLMAVLNKIRPGQ